MAISWGSSKSGIAVEDVFVEEVLVSVGGEGALKLSLDMWEEWVGAPAAVTASGREADGSWAESSVEG